MVLAFKNNTVASNEIQISAGERTRLQAQWSAALGDPVSVDAQVRTAKPVPVSDLLAIASSFGVSLPEGMKVQDGSIDLQLTARQTFGRQACPVSSRAIRAERQQSADGSFESADGSASGSASVYRPVRFDSVALSLVRGIKAGRETADQQL